MKNIQCSGEVLLRVSTLKQHGGGHFFRTLALRKHLPYSCVWFIDRDCERVIAESLPSCDEVYREIDEKSLDLLTEYANRNKPLFVICDSPTISHWHFHGMPCKTFYFCDTELEGCPKTVKFINYQPGSEVSLKGFVGTKYLPIDTQKRVQTNLRSVDFEKPINCLVSFGLTDRNNLMALSLVSILSDKQLSGVVRPVCMIPDSSPHSNSVSRLLDEFPHKKLVNDCRSIFDLIERCPVGIGAPGLSHAQRLFLGTATVLVPQQEIHENLCLNWEKEGCALYSPAQTTEISAALTKLIQNNCELARIISRRGQEAVDGEGAARLAASIINDLTS